MLSKRCLSVCSVCLSVTLVYYGKTAGWIKMKLGMEVEVGLGSNNIVLRWGPSSPSPKGHTPPIFGPYLLWPNRWMDYAMIHLCSKFELPIVIHTFQDRMGSQNFPNGVVRFHSRSLKCHRWRQHSTYDFLLTFLSNYVPTFIVSQM